MSSSSVPGSVAWSGGYHLGVSHGSMTSTPSLLTTPAPTPPLHHEPLSILLPDGSFQKANHIFNFSSEAENTLRNPSSMPGPARPSVICRVHLSHLISLSPWSPSPSHAKVGLPWQLLTRAWTHFPSRCSERCFLQVCKVLAQCHFLQEASSDYPLDAFLFFIFIQQIFMKHLLYPKQFSRHWENTMSWSPGLALLQLTF